MIKLTIGTRVRTTSSLGERIYGTVESFESPFYAIYCPEIGFTIYRRREQVVLERDQPKQPKQALGKQKKRKEAAGVREPKVYKCHAEG